MAETIPSTRYTLTGPWLFDPNDLDSLDQLLPRISDTLRARQFREIREAAESSVAEFARIREQGGRPMTPDELKGATDERVAEITRSRAKSCTPIVELLLQDKRTIRGGSLREVSEHSEVGLSRTMVLSIEFDAYPFASVNFNFDVRSGELSIRGEPNEAREIVDAFNVLHNWAVSRAPPRWQRFWMEYAWSVFPLVALVATIVFAALDLLARNANDQLRTAASNLLHGGIDPAKVPQAVEILLRSHFAIPVTSISTPGFPIVWALLLAFVVLLIFYGRPRPAIGIGITYHSPKRSASWLKMVSRVGPGALVTAILLPKLWDWILTHFK